MAQLYFKSGKPDHSSGVAQKISVDYQNTPICGSIAPIACGRRLSV
jgi:hypothetical protein